MRSKRYFRGVWEQRKTEEGDFGYFARAENGTRTKKRKVGVREGKEGSFPFPSLSPPLFLAPFIALIGNSLLLNRTETLATQASDRPIFKLVVCLLTWSMNESEARGDFAFIQTSAEQGHLRPHCDSKCRSINRAL